MGKTEEEQTEWHKCKYTALGKIIIFSRKLVAVSVQAFKWSGWGTGDSNEEKFSSWDVAAMNNC